MLQTQATTMFNTYTARPVCWSGWISDSYCSLKPLCSGMGEVVPARTSPTLLPPSPRTVLSLSCFKVQITRSHTDPHVQWVVSLVITDGHLISLKGLCRCVWVDILTSLSLAPCSGNVLKQKGPFSLPTLRCFQQRYYYKFSMQWAHSTGPNIESP